MPNVNTKKLTSKAHAASQVNVKPTTKANTPSVQNTQEKDSNESPYFLVPRVKKVYSKTPIQKIPLRVLKDFFEKNLLTAYPSGKIPTYQEAFNDLSMTIALLWDNMTTENAIQSFYHISEKMQILQRLQTLFEEFVNMENYVLTEKYLPVFCEELFQNGFIDESIEQHIIDVCEANVLIINALKLSWGDQYTDLLNHLEYFQKLYNFYNACNDYLISNPENN